MWRESPRGAKTEQGGRSPGSSSVAPRPCPYTRRPCPALALGAGRASCPLQLRLIRHTCATRNNNQPTTIPSQKCRKALPTPTQGPRGNAPTNLPYPQAVWMPHHRQRATSGASPLALTELTPPPRSISIRSTVPSQPPPNRHAQYTAVPPFLERTLGSVSDQKEASAGTLPHTGLL